MTNLLLFLHILLISSITSTIYFIKLTFNIIKNLNVAFLVFIVLLIIFFILLKLLFYLINCSKNNTAFLTLINLLTKLLIYLIITISICAILFVLTYTIKT